MRTLLPVVVVAGLLYEVAVSAKPNCTLLGFGAPQLMEGSGLPVCAFPGQQCCSEDFISYVSNTVRNTLTLYLRKEYNTTINNFLDEAEDLFDFFNEDFTEDLLAALPVADFIAINTSVPEIASSFKNLRDNFEIKNGGSDQFNSRTFYEGLVKSVIDYAVRYSTQDGSVRECVKRVISAQIQQEVITTISKLLEQLRKVISALKRISAFLQTKTIRDRLANATVLEQCVTDFVSTAFCPQCTECTLPLCLRTCNALLRGCYSPYYTVLNRQFAPLWVQVQRIVRFANETVMKIIMGEKGIVSKNLAMEIAKCLVPSPNGGRTRSHRNDTDGAHDGDDSDSAGTARRGRDGMFIPFGLVDEIFELTGAFEYDRRGHQGCLHFLQEETCALVHTSFLPGNSCAQQGSCNPGQFCTSECQCFDGLNSTRDNETTQIFDGNDVTNQGDNPVFTVDENVLNEEVKRIEEMGDPVADFLDSDEFKSVNPEGTDSGGDGDGGDGGDGGDSSASVLMTSIGVLLFAML